MLLGDDAGAELRVLLLPGRLSKFARPMGSFWGRAGGEGMDSQLLRLPVEPVAVDAVVGVVAALALALARYLDLASGLNMVAVGDQRQRNALDFVGQWFVACLDL